MSRYLIFTAFFLISCDNPAGGGGTPGPDPDPLPHPFPEDVWLDPLVTQLVESGEERVTVTVWFETQFLPNSDSFTGRQEEFSGIGRRVLREHAVSELKRISMVSMEAAAEHLTPMQQEGLVSGLKNYWIVNGFSCTVNAPALGQLAETPGVSHIYARLASPGGTTPPIGSGTAVPSGEHYDPTVYRVPWMLDSLRVPRVWKELSATGEGVRNVINDDGFLLDWSLLAGNVHINSGETPGNGVDDDGNGYVDDYHGFNFDTHSPAVHAATLNVNGDFSHGSNVAALIAGRRVPGSDLTFGVAPNSTWIPIKGFRNMEESVQWAVEQRADTYTMSFSLPGLAEYRSHWRRVMEHGTYCGIVFISGAGNFGNPNNPNFAPVPIQMRTPEDIPAVLSVAGVDQAYAVPPFSSKGPVRWETGFYTDGTVRKPDFTTVNANIPVIGVDGTLAEYQLQGNSFAGPHLAGIVALMLSANPNLKQWEIYEILQESSTDLQAAGFDYSTGHGLVDAYRAVSLALEHR